MPMKTRSAKSLSFSHLPATSPDRRRQGAARGAKPNAIPLPILIQSEVCPQINPPDLVVGRQAVGGAAPVDAAVVHDVGAVGNPQRLPDVVVRDQHADPAILQVK